MRPKISIITPSFNQGQYLEQTIDSVLSQGYQNLEYIIIDGGSTDNSVEIIKKYKKHIQYWISEPDNGQSDAINKGLRRATGDVCNWLCSDDYYETNALKHISEVFTNPNNLACSGNICLFDDKGFSEIKKGTLLYNSLPETIARSVNVQPSTFFRTDIFRQFNYLNTKLHYFMDKELWIKYLFTYDTGNFKYIDSTIAYYRIQPESKTFKEMDNMMMNPDKKFKIDNNSIFHSLAEKINNQKQSLVIAQLTSVLVNDYKIDIDANKELIQQVLDYYIYYEALKQFYYGSKKKCKQLLKCININNLNDALRNDFYYLKRRSLLSF